MNNKLLTVLTCTTILALSNVTSVYAHVTVKPSDAGIAQYTTFSVGVPTEKSIPTVGVRLIIPGGIESVRPVVKPGWKVEIIKQGTGEDSKVTELQWSGGLIPADQRDEFSFSAKTSEQPTTVQWKAYQTYSDGTVVAWDQSPKQLENAGDEQSNLGPYSETKIVDDLAATPIPEAQVLPIQPTSVVDRYVAYSALSLSIVALILALKKNK